MKIGDKVKFKDKYHEGIGTVVAKDGVGGYLVHSKGLKGHNAEGTTVEQDNNNNWWFKGGELEKIEERKQGMKTSELLKWLKERHINATETEYTITTHTGFTVYKDRVGVIKFHNSNTFDTEIVAKLVEYMDTPLEDRKEEKKFYIKPKGMETYAGIYVMGYDPRLKYWGTTPRNKDCFQTQFTLKELEDLGIDVEHYGLVEVK